MTLLRLDTPDLGSIYYEEYAKVLVRDSEDAKDRKESSPKHENGTNAVVASKILSKKDLWSNGASFESSILEDVTTPSTKTVFLLPSNLLFDAALDVMFFLFVCFSLYYIFMPGDSLKNN